MKKLPLLTILIQKRDPDFNALLGHALSFIFAMMCCITPLQAEETDNPFGVLEFLHWNHSWNNYKYPNRKELEKAALLMKKAGVGWVRVDFLWQDIEPQAGEFQFQKYDEIVEVLTEHNISILGILDYVTDWASSCKQWNCPPSDNSLFVNYAVTVAKRYKEKIRYWEIWNEPDSSTYWLTQDGLKGYCVLLKDVYLALKEVSPDFQILNGGLAQGIGSINRLYDNGAGPYFDILNIHIFDSPLYPGAIKRVIAYPQIAYKIMSRNGDSGKKIWVTEIGCPGVNPRSDVKNWWMGENPTERQQAQWVRDVYAQLLAVEPVEKVFWAFFRDCKGHWKNGIDYLGLVRWNNTKKAAFSAYRQAVKRYRHSRKHLSP